MVAVLVDYVVPVVHVLACLFLIVVVLLQTGKGADAGAVFGGGSQTLFGSSGAGNFLTKLTTGTAITFMVTSLILTYGASRTPTDSLLEKFPSQSAEVPPTPAPDATPPAATADAQVPAEQAPAEVPAPPADPGTPPPAAEAPGEPAPAAP